MSKIDDDCCDANKTAASSFCLHALILLLSFLKSELNKKKIIVSTQYCIQLLNKYWTPFLLFI